MVGHMRFSNLPMIAAAALLIPLAASSCKSDRKEKIVIGMSTTAAHFPKIKDVNAELDIVSPLRTFTLDQPALFVLRLTNLSEKRLVIYEWKMVDEYNARMYVAPWSEGQPVPSKDRWICLKPEIKNPRLMTLDLGQTNSTIIEKRIDFKNEVIKEGFDKPKTFLVYGELNLESITLKTAPAKVIILPQVKTE